MGILIAFFIQVFYDFIHEIIENQTPGTDSAWKVAQVIIIVIIGALIFALDRYRPTCWQIIKKINKQTLKTVFRRIA